MKKTRVQDHVDEMHCVYHAVKITPIRKYKRRQTMTEHTTLHGRFESGNSLKGCTGASTNLKSARTKATKQLSQRQCRVSKRILEGMISEINRLFPKKSTSLNQFPTTDGTSSSLLGVQHVQTIWSQTDSSVFDGARSAKFR